MNVYKSARNIDQRDGARRSADLNALSVLRAATGAGDQGGAGRRAREARRRSAQRRCRTQLSAKTAGLTGRCHETASHRNRQPRPVALEPHQIILRPLVTEKGMHRSTRNNAYAFEVNRAGRQGRRPPGGRGVVRREGGCECNTQNRKGKPRRTDSAAGTPRTGRRRSSRSTRSTASTSSNRQP